MLIIAIFERRSSLMLAFQLKSYNNNIRCIITVTDKILESSLDFTVNYLEALFLRTAETQQLVSDLSYLMTVLEVLTRNL